MFSIHGWLKQDMQIWRQTVHLINKRDLCHSNVGELQKSVLNKTSQIQMAPDCLEKAHPLEVSGFLRAGMGADRNCCRLGESLGVTVLNLDDGDGCTVM